MNILLKADIKAKIKLGELCFVKASNVDTVVDATVGLNGVQIQQAENFNGDIFSEFINDFDIVGVDLERQTLRVLIDFQDEFTARHLATAVTLIPTDKKNDKPVVVAYQNRFPGKRRVL